MRNMLGTYQSLNGFGYSFDFLLVKFYLANTVMTFFTFFETITCFFGQSTIFQYLCQKHS